MVAVGTNVRKEWADFSSDNVDADIVNDILSELEDMVARLLAGEDRRKAISFFILFRNYVETSSEWSENKKEYLIKSLIVLRRRCHIMNGTDICLRLLNIIEVLKNYGVNSASLSVAETYQNTNSKKSILLDKRIKLQKYISGLIKNKYFIVLVSIIFVTSILIYGRHYFMYPYKSNPTGNGFVLGEKPGIKNNQQTKVDVKTPDRKSEPPKKIVNLPNKAEQKTVSVQPEKNALVKKYEGLANADNPSAQFALGLLYETNREIKDDKLAKYWYEKAANNGNVAAMYDLGVLLLKDANNANWPNGVLWLRKAANYGLIPAQYNLGLALSEGVGTKKDIEEAFIWFSLASLRNDKDAIKMRDSIVKKLDAAQKGRAQSLLSIWRPQMIDEKANKDIESVLSASKQ